MQLIRLQGQTLTLRKLTLVLRAPGVHLRALFASCSAPSATRPLLMTRLLPFLAMFTSDQARAGLESACTQGDQWCNGGGLGVTWIPIVIVLQVAFLYLVLGGPRGVLDKFVEKGQLLNQDRHRTILLAGFPIALGLSFPVLIGLTLLDEWVRPVGFLEIAAVQGSYWLWLWLRAKRATALPPPMNIATEAAGVRPATAAVTNVHHAAAESAGTACAEISPDDAAAPPTSQDDVRKLIERLSTIYMWDNIGTGEPFRTARKLPLGKLATEEDLANFGKPLIDAMRYLAHRTVALYCGMSDAATSSGVLPEYSVPGFDEYSADVMQRLVCSVLADRQSLYIDQTDLEIFGENFVDCLYRLAILEVKSAAAKRSKSSFGQDFGRPATI